MTWEFLLDRLPWFLVVLALAASIVASAHAIMYKRDCRAALGWVGLIWLSPLLGAFLYYCLGINRIRRRSRELGVAEARPRLAASEAHRRLETDLADLPGDEEMRTLALLVERVTQRPLLAGNRVTPLIGGDAAFPAMLAAIDQAQRSVALCSYIFDHDRVGLAFLEALQRAAGRGVAVRVLIDDVGARYSRPTMIRRLRRGGLRAASFLPTRIPRLFHYANLRNHRKILVVDGRIGFTGGMNIREGHQLSLAPRRPIEDVHFCVEGPVVAHLLEAFVADWQFAARERLEGEDWQPEGTPVGPTFARGIPDGPDEDLDKLELTLGGAIRAARRSLHIVTPYFLPDASLISALELAALRGVDVHVVLPAKNNVVLVQWATQALLWQILQRGCRVWYTPPPFDHSKLMVVDGIWSLFGSTNWDPRSLRLNFELNVECYDEQLARRLTEIIEAKIARAREVTFAEVESRSIPIRLRDGAARLMSPYL